MGHSSLGLEWCTVAKPLDPWICSVQQTAAVKLLYRSCYGFHLDCCCRKPVLLPRLSPSTAAEPCRGASVQCRAVCEVSALLAFDDSDDKCQSAASVAQSVQRRGMRL